MENQRVRLVRERIRDDDLHRYDRLHLKNAPRWAYIDQDGRMFDTNIEQLKTDVEEYVTDHEEEEIDRGQTSAAGENNEDSEHFVMDD